MHNLKTPSKNQIKMTVLPLDVGQAMKVMIQVSERLLEITERETQALVRGDSVAFSIIQNEKEAQTTKYTKASSEFRARLLEFKGTDETLINRLEALQKELGEKTNSNSDTIKRVFSKSQKKTQESLLTAQELAQRAPLTFAEDAQAGANGK